MYYRIGQRAKRARLIFADLGNCNNDDCFDTQVSHDHMIRSIHLLYIDIELLQYKGDDRWFDPDNKQVENIMLGYGYNI